MRMVSAPVVLAWLTLAAPLASQQGQAETLAAGGGTSGPAAAQPATPPDTLAASPSRTLQLLRRGDEAMAGLEPVAAIEAYQAAVASDPANYEALWKSGRTLIDLGELEVRGNMQKDMYNKALKYAERAIKVNPDGADGHFVRAYALGRVALFEGGKTKIRLSREVRTEALRAIDLDPLHDGAYHIMGDWNYSLADLNLMERMLANTLLGGVPKDASFENAAHYYQLAIQANAGHLNHHVELARTLLKLDRREEAVAELGKALNLPATDLDDTQHRQRAQELLDRLS
ncbi:MAG: tetratricopeptide repeat protein [Gemmatimonadetes bacterium]|nr:tetratricopeptide repeat protein [Gemmatimonadota bacterium]